MATTAVEDVTLGTRTPVIAMLRRLQSAYVAEFDRRLRSSEFCALSLAHSRNVLRHLGEGPRRASQLVELAGVTKQAISQQLSHLEAEGYVRTQPDPADQRARLVALTDKGARAQQLVRRTFVEIEDDWGPVLGGSDRVEAFRGELELILGVLGEPPEGAASPAC